MPKEEMPEKTAPSSSISADERLSALLARVSQPQCSLTPSERRLALDVLGILLPQASRAMRAQLTQRLQLMDSPPRALMLAALHALPEDDVAQLLQEARLPDDLLVEIAESGNAALLGKLVKRRRLSAVVCTALAQHASHGVLAQMLRNEGAEITEPAWWKMLERATDKVSLQLALTERSDLPAPIGYELFWHVPSALRQKLIMRHMGTTTQLELFLQLAQAPDVDSAMGFLARLEIAVGTLLEGDRKGAARLLAAKLKVHERAMRRILWDKSGEAFAIMIKCSRLRTYEFGEMLAEFANGRLARVWPFLNERGRLQDFYAAMSTSLARAVMLYWDWRARNIGPYALLPPLET